MIINIPNYKNLNIEYLILDYNGTIASGGIPLEIKNYITQLAKQLKIFVLSGNTFSTIKDHLQTFDLEVIITPDSASKKAFIETLDPNKCIAIGNGNIDVEMIKSAALGIAVIGDEGCSTQVILNADLVITNIVHGFEMLLEPTKIIATLKR